MADLGKVLKGLECCADGVVCADDCPYRENCYDGPMFGDLAKDALELLKYQQAEIERLKDRIEAMKYEGVD